MKIAVMNEYVLLKVINDFKFYFFKFCIFMRKVFLFSTLALACIMGMTSCGSDDENGDVKLTDITVTPSSVSLVIGQSQKVTAKAVPENATGVAFEWSSAAPEIATVTQDGTISVVAVGTTTVTVKSGSISKSISVEGLTNERPLQVITLTVPDKGKSPIPVDDSVRLSATLSPTDATGVSLVWSSDNEEVAIVDETGLVTVVGIGTAKITVSSGSVTSSEIIITGTIKSLKVIDISGATAGFGVVGSIVQLSVKIDPDTTGLSPDSWTSSNDQIATVSPTGLLTVTGSGYATITATVNGVSASYTVTTESPFNNVFGYWRFDDRSNFGKAEKGVDLEIVGTVTEVDGPSATDLAIMGTKGEHNLKWEHQRAEDPVAWTMLFDTRIPGTRGYYALWWDNDGRDASFFLRQRDGELQIGRGSYPKLMDLAENDTTNWMRLVLVFVSNDVDTHFLTYIDGQPVDFEETNDDGITSIVRAKYVTSELVNWGSNPTMYFLSDGDGANDGDDMPHPVSAIAVWDRALSEQEVAALGGVK
jgi:uncharacterized protein YjdB